MELPSNITTFLKSLPLKEMRGEEVFTAIAFFLSQGISETEIEVKSVRTSWSKSIIGKAYNSSYATKAKGYIHPIAIGRFIITTDGLSYIQDLVGEISDHSTSLVVFKHSTPHSFDKFLRSVFSKATICVDIADTYVSGGLFDILLDEIPKTVPIRFVYGNDVGGFVLRAARFAKQYKLATKESKNFHDRFLVVDGRGYLIGPSLKDAADKKPATVVPLSPVDSSKIIKLFDDIWKKAK